MKKSYFLILSSLLISKFAYANNCRSLENDPLFNDILKEIKNEININDCNNSKAHLTFDDGPSDKTTGPILEAINKRNIKATFFITTTNLANGKPNLEMRQELIRKQIKSGHLVASHGHEHNSYDLRITTTKEQGFSDSERRAQIAESTKLLNQASNGLFSKQEFKLYRFPYGRGAMPSQKEIEDMERTKKMTFQGETYAEKLSEYRRQSSALFQIAEHGYSHLGWNHDSNDSSLSAKMPNNETIKKYVAANITALCQSKKGMKITLFHDIKEVNIRAIPLIADIGKCVGIQFLSAKETMNHKSNLIDDGVLISLKATQKAPVETVDEITKIIRDINKSPKNCPESKPIQSPKPKTCYSDYLKKSFSDCEGETSICFEGKWYGKEDPKIILNCGAKGY